MNIMTAIKERTSYRGKYMEKPVKQEDLVKILEAGFVAPSGCNKQTTSLIGVDDPGLVNQLYEVIDPPLKNRAPALICVLSQKIKAFGDVSFSVQDYSAAIQNMLLAIVGLGYQSCWIEGQITSDATGRKMADILGVPKEYELVCFLPVGYAAEPLRHVPKKAFEERVWLNGFKKHNNK